jgi:hypothetical protein
VATVTPAEAWVGDKQLVVSLNEDGQPQAQPRVVVGGDVKGGRYVSGVDDLVVGGRVLGATGPPGLTPLARDRHRVPGRLTRS